ncbi:MAG: hypothetical protein AVDCRST_MAG89-2115 [uncultured Gemmatimonadetes bacterium]|uniref:Uncharacterized protein n=1 Tax=uncultured Gemmatimonadota bacterium TaxID=203437 RepID=A0A6J4LJQ9_9BACT|nr:MAG: hypothetical protein AVDCRST_MAG89-2115 [uncultured Gemmatimonadota bacterium]
MINHEHGSPLRALGDLPLELLDAIVRLALQHGEGDPGR